MSSFESAEVVRDEEGRQYHIGLSPSDVAPFCMLVGDPARADRIAGFLDDLGPRMQNREFVSYTGTWEGVELTVLATGIGTGNMEISIVEYCQLVENPTFIRVGSCGGLQPEMELGDLVVSTGALKLESVSDYFVRPGHPAIAHHEVVLALIEAAEQEEHAYHTGITATACGFYGAQGRDVPGFPPRFRDLDEELARTRVMNMEMESSTLFTLTGLRGVRAGTVCAVYANRGQNVFIDTDTKSRAEKNCIETGLRAFTILDKMDRARGDAPRWRPSLGL